MKSYKEEYNYLLKRFYNGCEYLKTHPEEYDKYIKKLLNIVDQLDKILLEHPTNDSNEILNGFK